MGWRFGPLETIEFVAVVHLDSARIRGLLAPPDGLGVLGRIAPLPRRTSVREHPTVRLLERAHPSQGGAAKPRDPRGQPGCRKEDLPPCFGMAKNGSRRVAPPLRRSAAIDSATGSRPCPSCCLSPPWCCPSRSPRRLRHPTSRPTGSPARRPSSWRSNPSSTSRDAWLRAPRFGSADPASLRSPLPRSCGTRTASSPSCGSGAPARSPRVRTFRRARSRASTPSP